MFLIIIKFTLCTTGKNQKNCMNMIVFSTDIMNKIVYIFIKLILFSEFSVENKLKHDLKWEFF